MGDGGEKRFFEEEDILKRCAKRPVGRVFHAPTKGEKVLA